MIEVLTKKKTPIDWQPALFRDVTGFGSGPPTQITPDVEWDISTRLSSL